jgi:hypothetical protein
MTYRFTAEGKSRASRDDTEAWSADYAATDVELPVVGELYMLGESEYVGPHQDQGYLPGLRFQPDNGRGWGGNSNPNIRRYHGWRGTTNDWAFYGLGVRKCLTATVSGGRSKKVRLVFGRDLKRNQE